MSGVKCSTLDVARCWLKTLQANVIECIFDVVAFVMQNRKGVKSLLLRIEDSECNRMARQEKWKFNTFLNPFEVLVCVCVRTECK